MRRDITGRAVQRATARLGVIKARLQAEIPLGPNNVELTKKELMDQYASATPEQRAIFAASMGGTDTALGVLNGPS